MMPNRVVWYTVDCGGFEYQLEDPVPLVVSCFSDQIMRPKCSRTTDMRNGAEVRLNTVGSENVMIWLEQKFALGIVGTKVLRQTKVRSLENLGI